MTEPAGSTLVLTRFRPDRPAGGAALRNWQNIRALARLGPVDVVTIADGLHVEPVAGVRRWTVFRPDPPEPPARGLARWRRRFQNLRQRRHPALLACESRAAAAGLQTLLAETRYDRVLVEELALAGYVPGLRRAGVPVIFDAHNVEAQLRRELAVRRETPRTWRARARHRMLSRRLQAIERATVRAADLVWVCSELDADLLRRAYAPRASVAVVPNGVDVDAYSSPAAVPLDADWENHPLTLIYPGAFSYYPNEDAALRLIDQVVPALRRRGCQVRVLLVGRDPKPAMLAAAARDPDITVTGAVDDIRPYFNGPCLFTLPITLGSGTRLKIIEAFAARRPVISSAKGAEGIAAEDGRHLLLREQPEAIADAAIELWRSPALRQHLCDHALHLVRERYSWAAAARRIDASLRTLPTRVPFSGSTFHAPAPASANSASTSS